MWILIGYVILSVIVGIYAKVMHSQSFWYYTLFSLGITPLGGLLAVMQTAPVRLWWKKNSPEVKSKKQPYGTVHVQKFEKPKYNRDYNSHSNSSSSSNTRRNDDTNYNNPVHYSSSVDTCSSPSSSDSSSSTCSD